MKKRHTRNPAFDSLESREVLSTVGMAANARAQAIMAMEIRNQQQAEIRAERLAALRAAQMPHIVAAQQMSANSAVSITPARLRAMAANFATARTTFPSTVNVNGATTGFAMAPRVSLLNAPGFAPVRFAIVRPFGGGFSRFVTVNTVAGGPTALVGNLRVPITTILVTPNTGNTVLTSGTFATGGTVAFRNGLPVTTSFNTANTFANTSQNTVLPNGFPLTTGLNATNTTGNTLSPAIAFPNGFPTTTGFTPVFTTATTTPVVQTTNGLTMIV